jgi:hypothetical protein
MAGFKQLYGGAAPYNLQPSKEREEGRMEDVRKWWNTEVYQPKKKPMSMKEVFAAIAVGKE